MQAPARPPDATRTRQNVNGSLPWVALGSYRAHLMDGRMNSRKSGYSGLQISLHWMIAALVLFQLLFGENMTIYVDAAADRRQLSSYGQTMGSAHYWVGLAILLLVFVRLAVRLFIGAPKPQSTMPKWMAFASRTTHALFYGLLVAAPVSGLLAFYVWSWMGDVHTWAKPVFIVLICIHAGAALFHHFILKGAVLRRMLVPARDPVG
ncbi:MULTISPECIES: cytochrome b/b6 domain-containing protein [unclassified Mesorhizobium]|uniref:cytochrome b n=1 Tax=unclassified Mesorhizobium TaxID=325217 RepID=UPI001FDA9064|nr:cytochrome b/b6 domain-containing protein [Mesorhizobium sp. L103C119B0]